MVLQTEGDASVCKERDEILFGEWKWNCILDIMRK
jgi:hypothetical protein